MYGIKKIVQAGGYTWQDAHEQAIYRGKYVYVARVKEYPNVVLMYTSDKAKVAWYDHIGLTLGKSKVSGQDAYVVVIPRLAHGQMPSWYKTFYFDALWSKRFSIERLLKPFPDLYIEQWVIDEYNRAEQGRVPIEVAYMVLKEYVNFTPLASNLGREGVMWAKLLISFFDKNRDLLRGTIADFHANNIMFDGANKAYITDPCSF